MAGTMALVVAAGRGDRFGADLPKQYAPLAGRPLLRHSLSALAAHPGIGAVRAVIRNDDRDHYDRAAEGLTLLEPVPGGASRQESVREGLESLKILTPKRVLIHDGARPLLPGGVIDRVLAALDEAPGAIAALPVTDTLKRGEEGRIAGTVAREGLWRAQTPQGFHYPAILDAHRKVAAGFELTDDAAVAEAAGLAVRLVEGAAENIKVTTPDDLAQAEALLAGGAALLAETRTGSGFDVHRFAPGDHVNLCGLRIPHERALLGHSDADVGLHALTDAVLGALSAGDIGQHFPPSDPQWRGADSGQFLAHARDLVAARKGRIINVDITLICESPKLAPHRDAMIERVAELLGIGTERVSVKATTTEGLGFTGRGEGIAAQATATLSLPRGA
jgi:2-C-methyl-D-erythritol 4-phosphate cytidylyltransferase/2-C-methyl-D-erythritol 2,4-cyclodiphosphate synthase